MCRWVGGVGGVGGCGRWVGGCGGVHLLVVLELGSEHAAEVVEERSEEHGEHHRGVEQLDLVRVKGQG